jgi:hypothetical protein
MQSQPFGGATNLFVLVFVLFFLCGCGFCLVFALFFGVCLVVGAGLGYTSLRLGCGGLV